MRGDQFCLGDDIYLLSHSVGLMPKGTLASFDAGFINAWRSNPAEAWPDWMLEIDRFRLALARLFNHQAESFCPQTNVSSAITKALHALPNERERSIILVSEDAFPSIGFVAQTANRLGYGVRFIPSNEDCKDLSTWERFLADDVAVAIITHVHSNTGELIPAAEIAALARERNVWSIVDAAQSGGIVPIDLDLLGADVVAGSCVKWLCGGPGAGYLWIQPEVLMQCEPIDVGWFSHEDPFEFDIGHFRLAEDARRFWGGTPSVAPFTIAGRSIELMTEIGVENIREHNQQLMHLLLDSVDPECLVSPREPSLRSGTAILDFGHRNGELVEELSSAGIHVDHRAKGLRVSPHIYNTLADVEALASFLR